MVLLQTRLCITDNGVGTDKVVNDRQWCYYGQCCKPETMALAQTRLLTTDNGVTTYKVVNHRQGC